jgi:hypothetical protein
VIILLSLLVLQVAPPVIAQTNATNIHIKLNGPSVIGVLNQAEYSATVIDPENRGWDYTIWITASNDSGAYPLKELPLNGTLNPGNDSFLFNITAMQRSGELEIHVNCTSGSLYYETIQPITVVTPIIFNVDINNPTNIVVQNATVKFLVDGIEIDNQVIDSVPARQRTTVTTEWISADKEPGWHDSTILVDLNGDGIIDKDVGDMIVKDTFYIEGGSDWAFAFTVLIGLTALVVGFGLISRRKIR